MTDGTRVSHTGRYGIAFLFAFDAVQQRVVRAIYGLKKRRNSGQGIIYSGVGGAVRLGRAGMGAVGRAGGVTIGGTAQHFEQFGVEPFKGYVAGASANRTLEEALASASKNGIRGLENYKIVVLSETEWKQNMVPALRKAGIQEAYAHYGPIGKTALSEVSFSQAYLNNEGKILIRLRESVLNSDEAIVGVLRHEIHETQRLRLAWRSSGRFLPGEPVPIGELPGLIESAHGTANYYARLRILRMRGGQ